MLFDRLRRIEERAHEGAAHQDVVARSCAAAGVRTKTIEALPGWPSLRENHGEDVRDWIAAERGRGRSDDEIRAHLEALAEQAPLFKAEASAEPESEQFGGPDVTLEVEPELRREGLDLALVWPDGVRFDLAAIRDSREGVRGAVRCPGRLDPPPEFWQRRLDPLPEFEMDDLLNLLIIDVVDEVVRIVDDASFEGVENHHAAVTRAAHECRRLGVMEDRLR